MIDVVAQMFRLPENTPFFSLLIITIMQAIQSSHNPKIKHLAKLIAERKFRRAYRQAALEGVHLLAAYLDAGYLPECVFIPENRFKQPEILALIAQLPENICFSVSDNILIKISSLYNSDDVIAQISLPENVALPTDGDCVVLERVQDAGNVGTVLRSAAASGVSTVILGEGCADAYSPKVLRSGMGAHFLLTIFERVNLSDWCAAYRNKILATALTENDNFSLYDLNLTEKCAWIFGNEGKGVSDEILAQADATVKIPMQGATESLNIAQAATVCLFEQMRQRI